MKHMFSSLLVVSTIFASTMSYAQDMPTPPGFMIDGGYTLFTSKSKLYVTIVHLGDEHYAGSARVILNDQNCFGIFHGVGNYNDQTRLITLVDMDYIKDVKIHSQNVKNPPPRMTVKFDQPTQTITEVREYGLDENHGVMCNFQANNLKHIK